MRFAFLYVVYDLHLVRCIKRLNRDASPCRSPQYYLENLALLVVFSAIVLAIPFVENAIIRHGYPWVLPIVT